MEKMKKYVAKVVVKSFLCSRLTESNEEWKIEATNITKASRLAYERAKRQSWRTIVGDFKEYAVTTIFNSDDLSDKLDYVTC